MPLGNAFTLVLPHNHLLCLWVRLHVTVRVSVLCSCPFEPLQSGIIALAAPPSLPALPPRFLPSSLAVDGGLGCPTRREEDKAAKRERRAMRQKFERGGPVATKKLVDKKLKGKMMYMERLVEDAVTSAAQANEWLLPLEAGTLEPEGIERTANIAQVYFSGFH